MKRILVGVPVLVLLTLLLGPRPAVIAGLSDDGRVGSVLDLQGAAMVSPAGHDRWTPLDARSVLMPGDRVRTLLRGANAIEIGLAGGQKIVLGPGTIAALDSPTAVRLLRGEAELRGDGLALAAPESVEAGEEPVFVRVKDGALTLPEKPFRWLVGYRSSTTDEWMGSLVAEVDGRNTPLTIGYHKVSVVIRDQIAETTVEESFVNSTPHTLEGTFSFPLPSDASISGFGMWIGNELVMADIVERQKARAIYEDILRRKKDPGLLEWSGGNLFKARVFPIFPRSEKRIKIRYTQVLPMEGSTLRYRYALRSEMLRAHPLRALSIRVRMLSTLPVAESGSPSHVVETEATEHEVRLSYDAEEVTPEKDFEAEFRLGGVKPLTVITHQRGPDGYFALLLNPPDPSAGDLTRELAPEGDPVDLILLADTSGSMDAADRETQALFLESLLSLLGEKDTFRLGAVDMGVTWFREEALPATERNAADALAFLAARDSLGWTETERALADAASRARPATHVVVLGDGIGTSGDPDPAGLVRRIEALGKTAPGTWHAVATGSSYEASVLTAISRIGGGSFREAAADPAAAAYALLAEAASPAVKDLTVSFTDVRTARVYPEKLPNLPAGKQQVVMGRYLPGGGPSRGTVVVTGTLEGKPVRFVAPFALPEGDEGNSFLPRLWARRHVDALLKDATTPEVKEEIVGFSAEFGIMTPLTSFLVLESDADREFYGVERRVAMRDGERFFADAKDRVDLSLLQKAMRAAGLWRQRLRDRALADIANLGRSFYPVGVSYGWAANQAIGIGGGAGGEFAETLNSSVTADRADLVATRRLGAEEKSIEDPVIKDAKVSDHNESDGDDYAGPAGEVPPGERAPSEPQPPAASPAPGREMAKKMDALSGAGRRARQERYGYFSGGGGGGGSRSFREYARDRSGFDGDRAYVNLANNLLALFPGLAPPPVPPKDVEPADWPEDVLAVLIALDRRDEIDALKGGLRIESVSTARHPLRGDLTSRSSTVSLVSPSRWLVRGSNRGTLPVAHWCGETEVGVFREGLRLGRRRPVAVGDRLFRLVVAGFQTLAYVDSWRGFQAEIGSRDSTAITVVFTRPESEQTAILRIDPVRNVPLSLDWMQKGKVTQKTVWSDWTVVAGLPFAGVTESFDAEGHLIGRTECRVASVAADAVAKAVADYAASTADGIFLPKDLPTLDAAKQAAADGEADLSDRMVLLADFAARQQWDETDAEWTRIAARIGEKPGREWLHGTLLSFSRRGEELMPVLDALASRVEGAEPDAVAGLAETLYRIASPVTAVNEMLGLVERLRDALADGDDAPYWLGQYDRRIAAYQESAGRRDEALAIRTRLAAADPADPQLLMERVRALLQLRRTADAIEALTAALENEAAWNGNEADQVYQQLADLHWSAHRLDEFLATVERWLARSPERRDAWERRSVAWLFLGRVKEMDRDVLRVLAEIPDGSMTPAEQARAGAAIAVAMGQAWNYNASQLYPRFVKPLGDALLRLGRGDQSMRSLASWVLRYWRFRQTDQYTRVMAAYRADLFDAEKIATLEIGRLTWLTGLFDHSPAATNDEDFALLVGEIERRRTAEQDENRRRVLGELLVNLYDRRGDAKAAADVLRRRLAEETADHRPGVAAQLVDRLLRMDWTSDLEDEMFGLLPSFVPPDWPDATKAAAFANAARHLADGLERVRYEAALGPVKEREKLPRAELRQRMTDARKATVAALGDVFSERAGSAPALLAPWLSLESRFFAVRGEGEAKALEGILREALLSPAAVPDEYLAFVRDARGLLYLDYLAVKRGDEEGLADRVVALHRERTEQADERDRAEERVRWYRLLVALDRPDELVALLRSWIEPEKVESGFRIALAYLLAEQGKLAEAAAEFEAVAAKDELDAAGFETLASWYLALGEDERRERAIEGRYRQIPEYQLGQMLWSEYQRLNRRGPDGVPEDFDPEILRAERVLLGKASYPANYLYQVQNLYRFTKDFRLLAALADGIVGHTPEAIYPYLTQCWQILSDVHEEATLDEMSTRIRQRAEAARTGTDRRGLMFLTALVERRAAEVKNRPELHADKALPALKAAFPDEWLPGEPKLLAECLASLGRIPVEALAAEQVRQLEAIHRMADAGTPDGLAIAWAYARTLWGYEKHDPAIDVLAGALDATRQANGGRLGAQHFNYFANFTGWHEALGRFARGEELILAERERQEGENERAQLTMALFGLYRNALARGAEVSIGRGEKLYHAAFALMEAALADRPADYVDDTVNYLTSLVRTAYAKPVNILSSREELVEFARGRFRKALARVPNREQNLWLSVADTVRDLGDNVTGLTLLVEKLESDPEWYERVGRDGWQRFVYSMAQWRAQGGVEGPLEERLLRIVLTKLEEELIAGESHGNAFWHDNYSYFWREKRDDFATVARRVAELHADSAAILGRVSQYLWDGLDLRAEAVDLLVDLDERAGLAAGLRYRLAIWLQELHRHAEAIPHFERLLAENADHLNARCGLAYSLHSTDRDEEGRRCIAEGEKRLKEQERWNQNPIAQLAEVSFRCGYWEPGATYFEELVRIYERYRRAGSNVSGPLANYYGRLAKCLVNLGREDEAVKAASAAVVVFGNRIEDRQRALDSLVSVLAGLKDLDAYVAKYEAEVAETGLDAPVIRKSLGRVWLDRKEWKKAEAQLRAARELSPVDRQVHEMLVAALDGRQAGAEAIVALRESIRYAPGDLNLLTHLAKRLTDAGQKAEAERVFTTFVEREPMEARGHRMLAYVWQREKKLDGAIAQREIARDLRTYDPEVWFELVATLRAAGRTDEARAELAEMIRRDWRPEFGDVPDRAAKMMR